MAGRHRAPGAPSPSVTQRRLASWGPLVLLAGTATWTMGSLPDPAHPATGVVIRPPPGATAGVAVSAPLADTAPRVTARVPSFLAAGSVFTGATLRAVPTAALQRCQTEVLTGEATAQAGAAAYRDWARHVQAQLDLDTGRTTWLGAVATWNATRSAGGGDARAFEQAVRRRAATAGACGTLVTQTTGQVHEAATACLRRVGALDALVTAGATVTADWARHLDTIRVEADHAPGGPQALPWLRTARSALPALGRFRSARAALLAAPICRLPDRRPAP